ncbi:MAG: hypothetical protein A2915_00790 [Candidatus Yanofskybacteria bacterium RIFCSPLOWO2_01_FULL_41_34]|uniref:Uncharacterized protein n=1 Tax=Candidatus Yanofskybacteria bacterium RIFCSPHIGHO2_01_FULL_41_26 TaxID=1802661 RepID=A0A1F8EC57_9BACT|nr:MAG: hypothetical protein A2649_02825 [Candidatus Yanofskybacteria bacterium RIFCSPHIGHO2_01_FULL_41_26]OGN22431.1 MAG: hypothetical protein A2915_00790 [Candidatus Yanofskybacteria bacterium RIFCSPLOWO2_01_FULL_41_34]
MRLSIEEKAGIIDTSRIFETGHLSEAFLENMADAQKNEKLERDLVVESNKHFAFCKKCRDKLEEIKKKPKDQDLPFY